MIKKIKSYLLVAIMGLSLGAPALVPAAAGIASADIKSSLCTGVDAAAQPAAGTPSCTDSTNTDANQGLKDLAGKITNWFSIIVGAISIIMIIYGGFRYITSGGDSGKVGSAKNTLIYAIIGLIIVALAQLIVRFVITQADATTNNL